MRGCCPKSGRRGSVFLNVPLSLFLCLFGYSLLRFSFPERYEYYNMTCKVIDVLPYSGATKDTLYESELMGEIQKIGLICIWESFCYTACSGIVVAGSSDSLYLMFFNGRLYDSIVLTKNIENCFNIWQPCVEGGLCEGCCIVMHESVVRLLTERYGVHGFSSCRYVWYLSEPFWIELDRVHYGHYNNRETFPVVGEGAILCLEDSLVVIDEGFMGVVLRCKYN